MSAVWAWVRLDLRHRARSLLVLALLVAVTTGVVLTATAGARRGSTAVERLVGQTKPATVAALPNEPGFDWDAVAELASVEAVGRFAVADFELEGFEAEEVVDFPYGAPAMVAVERPVVLEGRMADPSRVDEGMITAAFEERWGLGVGDRVTVRLFTGEQADAFSLTGEETPPAGPRIETTIVGVVRSAWFSDSGASPQGRFIPSTALLAEHEESFIGTSGSGSVNALVRLEDGAAGIPQFRQELTELTGRRDIEFLNGAEETQHIRDVTVFEANALLGFAAAALVAAVFIVGQSLVRYVAATTQDLRILGAVGMSPRHIRAAAAIAPTVAAALGAIVGALGAFLASSRFPTGTAAPLEPSPGPHADLVVLGTGLVLVPILVALGAVAASWAASRAEQRPERRRAAIPDLLARAGAPVPVTVGASFALDRGRGSQALPVVPAVLGSVVGVLGVVGALTFAAGINDAIAQPERFGQVADLEVFVGFGNESFVPADEVLEVLAADPEVLAVNDSRQGVLESGVVDLAAFAIAPVDEPLPIVVLEGELPAERQEVAVSAQTATELGAEVGDRIELSGSRSTGMYEVSGIAFVPEGLHNAYDSGAWIREDTYDELIDGFKFRTIPIVLQDGADVDAAQVRLGSAVAEVIGAPPDAAAELVGPPTPPVRLGELQQIQRLPLLLAGFLALLAVGAVGHALATAVRRRRHDLAVLRAVGATRAQSRATVLVQATVLALVGVAFGVPLGLAAGRTLWETMAESTPVAHVPPLTIWALVLVGPVALLVANLLAIWPSRRAASLRVGPTLRTE
ncbi:MAG: FtsX-like permease family protein [Acidimicrobiales bacterium]